MNKSRLDIVLLVVIYTFFFIILLLNTLPYYNLNKLISYIIIAEDIYLLICSRKRVRLLIIFLIIFWANYSILVANILSPIDSFFTSFQDDPVMRKAINILFIFNSLLLLIKPYLKNTKENIIFFEYDNARNNRHNSLIVTVSIIVLIINYFWGFTRPDEIGERGSPSVFYEYSIIIFIVTFYYTRQKIERVILMVLALLYAGQNMIFGGRVTALQLLLMLLLIFINKKFTTKKLIIPALIIIPVFITIGMLRATWNLEAMFPSLIEYLKTSKLTWDTGYSSFFCSTTFIKVADDSSVGLRLHKFGLWILSIFLGGNQVEGSNLAEYTHDFYMHYYGGIPPYHAYFYLGYFGVILIGLYIVFLLKKLTINDSAIKNSGLLTCLSIYFVVSTPRWYLYSLSSITRGLLLVIVVWYVFKFIHKATTYKQTDSVTKLK